jgi:hypothetical protein
VEANVKNKLGVIIDQIQFLQQQARSIMEKAKMDSELHKAACNIKKINGQTYYYYRRDSGEKYLSIMSPSDWNGKCPHEYLGGFRLEYDNSWTSIDKIDEQNERSLLIQKIMNKSASVQEALTQ